MNGVYMQPHQREAFHLLRRLTLAILPATRQSEPKLYCGHQSTYTLIKARKYDLH